MNKGMIHIVITTYNCPKHIDGLLRSLAYQTYDRFQVTIADDGSTDNTPKVIEGYMDKLPIRFLKLSHGERGIARVKAIAKAIHDQPEFLLILDGDMILRKDLLDKAIEEMIARPRLDGLILEEIPYSNHRNYFTKVKIFERQILNNSISISRHHSIEAARFWRVPSYLASGGIKEEQIAFEEIQPTLRCIDQGGYIDKLMTSGLYHDEKLVTLVNLLKKKHYYFSKMPITLSGEKQGLKNALKRWYLFRPVYYRSENLKAYIKHPVLFLGMVWMYLCLTMSGTYNIGRFYLKNAASQK